MDLTTVVGTLANYTNDGIIVTDAPDNPNDLAILYVNPALERICGYTGDELRGRNPRFLQRGDRCEATAGRIREAIIHRRRVRERLRNYRKDTTPYWIEIDIAPVIDNGRAVYFVAVEREVTAKVRREMDLAEMIRENRAALDIQSNMLDILPAEVALLDSTGVIRMTNDAWQQFARDNGGDRDFKGMNYVDVCRSATDSDGHGALMADALCDILGGRRDMADMIYPCHCEGDERWFSVMARGFDTAQGRMAVVMHVDVTARVRAERRLSAQAQEMEADAAAAGGPDVSGTPTEGGLVTDLTQMSHELRTPLNAIIGYSDMIKAQIRGAIDPAYVGYASSINDAGHHLLTLITEVLDASRLGAGHLTLAEQDVAVADLIRSVAGMVHPQAAARDVRLAFATAPAAPLFLTCDPLRMKQALLNFVSNAVKFTPAGGTVGVTARLDGDVLEIVVDDTGIGMAPADLRNLFKPYRRARNAAGIQGTGLGMVIARGILDAHGASVAVDSEENRGTTVTVRLPADRVRCAAQSAADMRMAGE